MAVQDSGLFVAGTRFGDLPVDNAALLDLVAPLAGFPGTRRVFVHAVAGQEPFVWVQSVDEPQVAFPALDPSLWFEDWSLGLASGDAGALGAGVGQDMKVLCLASLTGKGTLNLAAPLVICPSLGRAMQVIDTHADYPLDQPLFG